MYLVIGYAWSPPNSKTKRSEGLLILPTYVKVISSESCVHLWKNHTDVKTETSSFLKSYNEMFWS